MQLTVAHLVAQCNSLWDDVHMLGKTYEGQDCSIARSLEVIGERWTLLILRDAVRGTRRFDDFLAGLGIARNILAVRLSRLVDEGLLERVQYQERPVRHEYRLTPKGSDLQPVLMGLLAWGDRYCPCPDGPPAVLTHTDCGHQLDPVIECAHCGGRVDNAKVEIHPGPGAGSTGS